MASRTPEEILAQRDAWLARKAAREAGEDVPFIPPTRPGEEPPPSVEAEAVQSPAEPEAAQPAAEAEVAQPAAEPEPPAVVSPSVEPDGPQPTTEVAKPQSPPTKRTPEEIRAQREAFLAARAAKAAGTAPEAPAPAPAPPAAKPAEPAPAQPAAKPVARPQPKPKAAPAKKAAPPPPEPSGALTRREFLNYAWLASITLFSLETVGIALWFAFPNFVEGQFGGLFPIGQAGDVLPELNAPPKPFSDGKFWLVNLDTEVDGEPRKGVLALYKICTHLGCLYEWADVTNRFECPCHGSKFQLTGDYIAGPARRSLDRFVVIARSPDGSERSSDEGKPLVVNDDDELIIDTGARILGSSDITPA